MNTFITGNVKFYNQSENLQPFINLMRKYPPFSPEQEQAAFKKYKGGDSKAREEIFLRNQRWVFSLAKEYARNEDEVMDYVEEGNIGLNEAIEKFVPEMGNKFITFAVWYIRREMNAYLNNERDLLTKPNTAKLGKKVDRIKNAFYLTNGRTPTYDEIKTGLKEKYDIDVFDDSDLHDLEIMSINAPVDDDEVFETTPAFTKRTSSTNLYDDVVEREIDDERKRRAVKMVKRVFDVLDKEPQGKVAKEFLAKVFHIGYDITYTKEKICEEYKLDDEGYQTYYNKCMKYLRQEIESGNLKLKE